MLNFYSSVDSGVILFTITRKSEITSGRSDLTPPSEFLQAGVKKMKKGKFFKPHKHLPCQKVASMTQEAWVILDGKAEGCFYDLDDSLRETIILNDGDCAIIYNGGHSLRILEDNTILYEFKTGPYLGPIKDKVFLK